MLPPKICQIFTAICLISTTDLQILSPLQLTAHYFTIIQSLAFVTLVDCHRLSAIFRFIRERVKPIVKTEQEFLYVCHLIGPFLYRFQQETTYCCIEVIYRNKRNMLIAFIGSLGVGCCDRDVYAALKKLCKSSIKKVYSRHKSINKIRLIIFTKNR